MIRLNGEQMRLRLANILATEGKTGVQITDEKNNSHGESNGDSSHSSFKGRGY
jgi:hypothetical protein